MKVGYHTASPGLCRDDVIFSYASPMRRDETNKKYGDLKINAKRENIDISCLTGEHGLSTAQLLITSDVNPRFDEMSKRLLESRLPKFLILEECGVIRPDLWRKSLWDQFNIIFTNDDSIVDGEKFIHLNMVEKKDIIGGLDFKSRKLVSLISANKCLKHPNELYSERLNIVKWYEKNKPNHFDLFGFGWDEKCFPLHSSLLTFLNAKRLRSIRKLLSNRRPSWRGTVVTKAEVLGNYKFTIAFENAKNLNGYILEKIFDAIYAESVPIYFGAKNIEQYIPKSVFVDYRDFKTLEELHKYINSISEVEYLDYVKSAHDFMNSRGSFFFSSQNFSDNIIKHIKKYER
jgi:alpha(1,3/1,4) fucosyltransferase